MDKNLILSSQQDKKTAQPNSNNPNQIYQSQQVQQNQIDNDKTKANEQKPQSSKQPIIENMRNSNDISPQYRVYQDKENNKKVIVLQIPGIQFIDKITVKHETTQLTKVIRVKGQQSQKKIDEFYNKTLKCKSLDDFDINEKYLIEYGKFDIRIPIGPLNENIDITRLQPDYQYVKDFGLLVIPVQFLAQQDGSDSDF